MSLAAIVLLIILAIVVVFVIAALVDEDPAARTRAELRQLDDQFRLETARHDQDLANFLTELHRQNRETYRRIKEAGRKA
jgi:uncharacterized membrane protein (DUF106 family)